MDEVTKLKKELKAREKEINKALAGYRRIWLKENNAVFSELVFCLCTAQSNALKCNKAVKLIEQKNCLVSGTNAKIKKCLKSRARFHNNKTQNILRAQKLFSRNKKIAIKKILSEQDIESNPLKTRTWLVENVKGLGLKEASHFLRNIGFYEEVSILDRHILRNLVKLKVIEEIPSLLTEKKYFEIEKKLFKFCKKEKIQAEKLDLVLWARETGFVFK